MASQKVVIDPVTRIEGHLRITVEVENGKVKDAWNTCTLFRGFEVFMKDRDPRDCWQFTMRICGVCPTPHGVTGAQAAERAMGVATVPDNARLVRNMLEAAMLGYDHILWFYQLNAMDYVNVPDALNAKTTDPELVALQGILKNVATSGQPELISNQYWENPGYKLTPDQNLLGTAHYLAAIQAQQYANQASAVLSGKFPMVMTLAAGGVTTLPDEEAIIYYKNMMLQVKNFNDNIMWNDLLMVAKPYIDLATYGQGCGNFLTWGVLEGKSQKISDSIFPAGAVFTKEGLKVQEVSPEKVVQFTKYSYFPDDLGAGKNPINVGQEPQDFTSYPPMDGTEFPTGKYDWTQAARYPNSAGDTVPMEVGPLAEVLVAYLKGEPKTKEYVDQVLAYVGATGKPEILISNLGRIAARVIKSRVNTDYALDWADQLLANMKAGDLSAFTEPTGQDGSGWGAEDAPRGALAHYCEVQNGKVAKWAAVPASNWNLSPRDDKGVRGPVEEALVGTPVPNPEQPLEILRTVHTFDP